MSAVHSIEETIQDQETRYSMIELILSLHNNWSSFLDMLNKTILKWRNDSEKDNLTIKSLNDQLKAEKKNYEEKSMKEKAKFEMKPLVQQFNMLKEKHQQLKISFENEKKDMANQISLKTVSNKVLEERLKKIEEDTEIKNTQSRIHKLTVDLHQAQEMLKAEKEARSTMGYQCVSRLEVIKKELKEKDDLMNEKAKEFEELQKIYFKTKNELEEKRATIKENTEKMAMTNEDILQIRLHLFQKDQKLNEKNCFIEEQNKKMGELEIQLKLQREGLVQKSEISTESTLFLFTDENAFARHNNQNKSNAREEKQLLSSDFSKKKFETEKVSEKIPETGETKLDSINLNKYAFLRPKYRAYINDLLPLDERDKVNYAPPFPVWLHVTIRAIFDSKFNEILLSYNKGKRISRFPDFVFSWLGNFCIDKDNRNIKLLEYTEKESVARENRSNLLLGLEASSAAKLWEITIFKDFLEEALSLDELVFFLHGRFLLFKGPQLSIPTAGFCVTHFVTKEKVFDTIDKVMYKYQPEERKDFKRKLTEFSKQTYKDANAFDSAMVLRIMLEFYRKGKKENYAKLEELYRLSKKTTQANRAVLPFESFYDIMAGEYDKSISDQDVCSLYREAFIAGGCAVNIDSILVAISETYLF